jgi:L-threonylcarbamoyladenylate synthase
MSVSLQTRVQGADRMAIAAAARCLADGGLVAFPTETVYGLGADATNGAAVARLYAAKGRPSFNPLIAHVIDTAAARRLACFDATAEGLAAAFWPGPLTLVLPSMTDCPVADLATAGLETIAVRVPVHDVARDLLAAFGKPIVAPSANRSGHVSPTTAQHVKADLGGRIDMILDGGPTSVGVESTIVACLGTAPVLLRSGGIARTAIEQILGEALAETPISPVDEDAPLAPGQLASHYAPRTKLRLNAMDVQPGEVLLAFGPTLPAGGTTILNLSDRGDVIEAAANLFSYLRRLDAAGATAIAVMPVPDEGLGEAINDRLRRAAAPATMADFIEASRKYRGLGLKIPPRSKMDITPRRVFDDDES